MGVAILPHRVLQQGAKLPEYTYTGSHQLIDDGDGNWRIKFLTSGTLTFSKKPKNIDVFLVGGGGSGGYGGYGDVDGEYYGPGGGGGYTKTEKNIAVTGTSYSIVVGAGGKNGGGGTTSAFGHSASGGERGTVSGVKYSDYGGAAHYCYGGCGGSAGGSTYSVSSSVPYGSYGDKIAGMKSAGGSDGSNTANYSTYAKGQGMTTREFGESSGTLYAGGGGCNGSAGGAGGGGKGGRSSNIDGDAGSANTGGGGGGGPYFGGSYGAGGSGIVIIRNAR